MVASGLPHANDHHQGSLVPFTFLGPSSIVPKAGRGREAMAGRKGRVRELRAEKSQERRRGQNRSLLSRLQEAPGTLHTTRPQAWVRMSLYPGFVDWSPLTRF